MAREAAGAGGGVPAARPVTRSRPPHSAQAQQEQQRPELEGSLPGTSPLRGHRIRFRRLRLKKLRKSGRQLRLLKLIKRRGRAGGDRADLLSFFSIATKGRGGKAAKPTQIGRAHV